MPTKEELMLLIGDSNDPTSINYKRTLTYPKFNVKKILINIFIVIIVEITLILFIWFISKKVYLTILIPIFVLILYMLIRASSILIFFVECYQKFAKKETRMRCLFEPSCSDYMIKSIKKYGAFRGLIKGVKRLRRCRYPNGGYDEP